MILPPREPQIFLYDSYDDYLFDHHNDAFVYSMVMMMAQDGTVARGQLARGMFSFYAPNIINTIII